MNIESERQYIIKCLLMSIIAFVFFMIILNLALWKIFDGLGRILIAIMSMSSLYLLSTKLFHPYNPYTSKTGNPYEINFRKRNSYESLSVIQKKVLRFLSRKYFDKWWNSWPIIVIIWFYLIFFQEIVPSPFISETLYSFNWTFFSIPHWLSFILKATISGIIILCVTKLIAFLIVLSLKQIYLKICILRKWNIIVEQESPISKEEYRKFFTANKHK